MKHNEHDRRELIFTVFQFSNENKETEYIHCVVVIDNFVFDGKIINYVPLPQAVFLFLFHQNPPVTNRDSAINLSCVQCRYTQVMCSTVQST
jgi:hypothetical protein